MREGQRKGKDQSTDRKQCVCLAQYGGQHFILTAGFSVAARLPSPNILCPDSFGEYNHFLLPLLSCFLVSIEARLLLPNTIFTAIFAVDAILKAELFFVSVFLSFSFPFSFPFRHITHSFWCYEFHSVSIFTVFNLKVVVPLPSPRFVLQRWWWWQPFLLWPKGRKLKLKVNKPDW